MPPEKEGYAIARHSGSCCAPHLAPAGHTCLFMMDRKLRWSPRGYEQGWLCRAVTTSTDGSRAGHTAGSTALPTLPTRRAAPPATPDQTQLLPGARTLLVTQP